MASTLPSTNSGSLKDGNEAPAGADAHTDRTTNQHQMTHVASTHKSEGNHQSSSLGRTVATAASEDRQKTKTEDSASSTSKDDASAAASATARESAAVDGADGEIKDSLQVSFDLGTFIKEFVAAEACVNHLSGLPERIKAVFSWDRPAYSGGILSLALLCCWKPYALFFLPLALAARIGVNTLYADAEDKLAVDPKLRAAILAYERRMPPPVTDDQLNLELQQLQRILRNVLVVVRLVNYAVVQANVLVAGRSRSLAKWLIIRLTLLGLLWLLSPRMTSALAVILAFSWTGISPSLKQRWFTLPPADTSGFVKENEALRTAFGDDAYADPQAESKEQSKNANVKELLEEWEMVDFGEAEQAEREARRTSKSGKEGKMSGVSKHKLTRSEPSSKSAAVSSGGSDDNNLSQSRLTASARDSVAPAAASKEHCANCQAPFGFLRNRYYCRHCGQGFCRTCCRFKVYRSVFGATAPAAKTSTVRVCERCHRHLVMRDKTLLPHTSSTGSQMEMLDPDSESEDTLGSDDKAEEPI